MTVPLQLYWILKRYVINRALFLLLWDIIRTKLAFISYEKCDKLNIHSKSAMNILKTNTNEGGQFLWVKLLHVL